MTEKDTADPTSSTPSQEPLTVEGGAAQLLDRFPEDDPSPTEPDPEPTDDAADSDTADEPDADDDADSGGLEDDPDEPVVEPPPLHKVKVDGVEEEITLDEALKGYSRTADYKNKTRQLADDRRKFEAESVATRQARDAYAEKLKLVDQALDEPAPDWVKARGEMSPEDFQEARIDWQLRQEERQKVQVERKRVAKEQDDEALQQHQVYQDGEAQLLQEKIPEFAESEKAGKMKADLFTYGGTQGFSRDEMANIGDHRALVILNKARLYDAIVARKGKTKEKAKTSPTVKPGGRPPTPKGAKGKKAREAALKRLGESGHIDDAVAALMDFED
jgi:hypothetical protein